MREYLLVLLASAAITYVTVPVVRWYAVRWNVMAEIRDRDVHDIPIPRLGGVAMYLGFLAGMLVASQLGRNVYRVDLATGAATAVAENIEIPAAIGFDTRRMRLLVPQIRAGSLSIYELGTAPAR